MSRLGWLGGRTPAEDGSMHASQGPWVYCRHLLGEKKITHSSQRPQLYRKMGRTHQSRPDQKARHHHPGRTAADLCETEAKSRTLGATCTRPAIF